MSNFEGGGFKTDVFLFLLNRIRFIIYQNKNETIFSI